MLDLVVDANVVLKWIPGKNEMDVVRARELYLSMTKGECQIWAPKFLLVEVLNILIKKRKAESRAVSRALDFLLKSGLRYWEMEASQASDLGELMRIYGITAYDALYLLLARELGGKLVTYDDELLKIKEWTTSMKEVVF